MSLLGQIKLVHSVSRVRSIGQAPHYVKGLTYDRLHQQFERPHNALGNRYRNPVERAYDTVMTAFRTAGWTVQQYIQGFAGTFRRIEISVRIRPQ